MSMRRIAYLLFAVVTLAGVVVVSLAVVGLPTVNRGRNTAGRPAAPATPGVPVGGEVTGKSGHRTQPKSVRCFDPKIKVAIGLRPDPLARITGM